jgi:signal recognition particle subunit SRP54
MFETLKKNLEKAIQTGHVKINEKNISESLMEVRIALLDADVNIKVVKKFLERVKKKALGKKVLERKLLIKIFHDELVELMGIRNYEIDLSKDLSVVFIFGLQGSGKTTFSVKLAHFFKKKRKKTLISTTDIYRPAGIHQIKVLGDQIGVTVITQNGNENPLEIAKRSVAIAKEGNYDVLIIDTAGRLAIDKVMMAEMERIYKAIRPYESLFIVDAMTGQDAANTAKNFKDVLDFNGVVLNKLDGDARGGAALTVCSISKKPIKFIGTGEKIEDLDIFYPDRIAKSLLGMEDSHIDQNKNKFDFNDFLSKIHKGKKMVPVKDLLGMMGMVNIFQGDLFKKTESIIYSMTEKERKNPELINESRKIRIYKGSGNSIEEVDDLLKKFQYIKKIISGS